MKLFLIGHDYKYAVEQMLLTLFPDRRPRYPDTPPRTGEDALILRLSEGDRWVTATAKLCLDGCVYTARRRCRPVPPDPVLERDRAYQRILKLAFYQAGTQAGVRPPWGALTGVRPVKLPERDMAVGASPQAARKRLEREYFVTPPRARLAVDCAGASLAARRSLAPDEISVYVGIPFCPTRCAYCSFISADVRGALGMVEPYLDALIREIEAAGDALKTAGRAVRTVYIGGGAPTTLSAGQLDRLLTALRSHLPLDRCTEFTVEAGRPDTITEEKLLTLRTHGVSRISINPQTLEDAVLDAIGRRHSAGDVLSANALARGVGFECINMDLIAGLPRDGFDGFCRSLTGVLAMAPENITVHTLALKRGSRLMEQGDDLPSGDEVARMLAFADSALRSAGYLPYYLYRQKYTSGSFENVGWALPGKENLYNICMMEELHSVLSLGAGGVTKLVDHAAGSIRRVANPKYPYEYLDQLPALLTRKRELQL